jgi:hypothetical protein
MKKQTQEMKSQNIWTLNIFVHLILTGEFLVLKPIDIFLLSRMPVHLPNKNYITYNAESDMSEALSQEFLRKTMLI